MDQYEYHIWYKPKGTDRSTMIEWLNIKGREGGWMLVSDREDYVLMMRPLNIKEERYRRPWLLTYGGVRIDESEVLYGLYQTIVDSEDPEEKKFAKMALRGAVGSGGWDDICRDCPDHRYEHKDKDHPFISEEQ